MATSDTLATAGFPRTYQLVDQSTPHRLSLNRSRQRSHIRALPLQPLRSSLSDTLDTGENGVCVQMRFGDHVLRCAAAHEHEVPICLRRRHQMWISLGPAVKEFLADCSIHLHVDGRPLQPRKHFTRLTRSRVSTHALRAQGSRRDEDCVVEGGGEDGQGAVCRPPLSSTCSTGFRGFEWPLRGHPFGATSAGSWPIRAHRKHTCRAGEPARGPRAISRPAQLAVDPLWAVVGCPRPPCTTKFDLNSDLSPSVGRQSRSRRVSGAERDALGCTQPSLER